MQIETRRVATIDYTLTDENGTVVDTSEGGEPITYVHGFGTLIPGLERALEGKSPGDSVQVTIPPEEGYGERDEEMYEEVPREMLEGLDEDQIQVGMRLHAATEEGTQIVTVKEIQEDSIVMDTNHPLAGLNLHFDVTVRDVREATHEEIEEAREQLEESEEEFEGPWIASPNKTG